MKRKILAVALCAIAFFIGTFVGMTFSKTEKVYIEKPVVPYGYINLFDVGGWETFRRKNRVCLELQMDNERYEVSKDAFTVKNIRVRRYPE